MAEARQLSCGLRGCCKSARQGLGFPASEPDAIGTPRPYLPPELVLLIDAIMRAAERAEMLLAMNGGNLGSTLWDAAAREGGLLEVRFLLAAGADAGAEHGDALNGACRGGHLQVAEALLDAGGTLTPYNRNRELLCTACAGRTACCELLLDRGADINAFRDIYGVDALCAAARSGHQETVEFLLDRGADAWSEEALKGAAERHHDAVVALLLARRGGGGRAGPPSDRAQ